MAVAPPAGMWRYPFCQSTGMPVVHKKVSTGGWVVFALLVVFCVVLCWIGLLMKEDERRCMSCGSRVG